MTANIKPFTRKYYQHLYTMVYIIQLMLVFGSLLCLSFPKKIIFTKSEEQGGYFTARVAK